MNPRLWQGLIVIGALIATVHIVLDFAGDFYTGGPGVTMVQATGYGRHHFRVTAIQYPEQARPPLRIGDVVRLEHDTLAERLRYANSRAGDTFRFVRTDGTPVTITLRYFPPNAFTYVFALLRLSMVGMALLLALRRPGGVETRTLATFLLLFGFAIAGQAQPFLPDPFVLVTSFLQQIILIAALAQAVRLATIFPDPNAGGIRARIRAANPFFTVTYICIVVGALSIAYFSTASVPRWLNVLPASSTVYYIVAIVIPFTVANRTATGADLTRVRWVSYTLAAGFSGVVIQQVAYLSSGGSLAWWVEFAALTLLAIPLGLGYAIARHRVVDIGFVVNRAIVFAVISAIVVVSFGVLEWILGKYLVEMSHATSASLEVGLALLLGASLRQIHRRVEKFADDLFFRKRHVAEAELKRFALDAQYITDLGTIFERTVEEVRRHAEARDCALYLIDGNHFARTAGGSVFPPTVDENDPLFVRLRATREACAVHGLPSAIDAEIAFPFIVRGAVSGALVCSAKVSGETYAPDERAVLADVARSVGVASDTLYTDALRREIERVLGARPALSTARDLLLRSATGGAESAL